MPTSRRSRICFPTPWISTTLCQIDSPFGRKWGIGLPVRRQLASFCRAAYLSPPAMIDPGSMPAPAESATGTPHLSDSGHRKEPFEVVHLPDLPGVPCPCGIARRAYADATAFPGTVHLTEIHSDARTHYHRDHTEVYVIWECEPDAAIELDGQRIPLRPQTSVLIPPGVRHRACGKMKVLIICTPEFDSNDEHFD